MAVSLAATFKNSPRTETRAGCPVTARLRGCLYSTRELFLSKS